MARACACDADLIDGMLFCERCGTPLQPETTEHTAVRRCAKCNTLNAATDKRCQLCGAMLTDPSMARPTGAARFIVIANGAVLAVPDADEVIIGRADPNSQVYPEIDVTGYGGEEGGVSRRHARLIRAVGRYTIEDLSSINFTFLNKQRLEPLTPAIIKAGDELKLGRLVLRFELA
jgi:hypothetical protein